MINSAETRLDAEFRDLREKRGDSYVYQRFSEQTNPDLAMVARQVHARGYRGEEFVHGDAIMDDGSLTDDIDKARGSYVDYYLGYERGENGECTPVSTLRKVNIPYGGTLDDLPAYALCKDQIYAKDREWLDNLPNPQRIIKEISSFAHIPEVGPMAGFELLRNALQDSLGSHEVWLFSMVADRYQSLVKNFGPVAVRQIGEAVPIDDPRVNHVKLIPAIVDTDLFLQQVHDSIVNEEDESQKRRIARSFYMFTESLADYDMSTDVATMSRQLRGETQDIQTTTTLHDLGSHGSSVSSKSFGDYIKTLGRDVPVWTQPDEFDFASWADRREVRRRIESGSIISTVDRLNSINDELFELRHPDKKTDVAAKGQFLDDIEYRGERSGRWFHFPWSQSLVHYLEQSDHQDLRTFRNRNLITMDEQAKLLRSKILVAGLSVGSSIVEQLTHSGIGGTMILGDYDSLSVANLNRVDAGMPQVGMKKIDIAAIKASELDPYVHQVHFREGISADDMAEIARLKPDIIFEAVDDLTVKALLRQFASRHKIPLIMGSDVGDKSIIDIERHDQRLTAEFNGKLNHKEVGIMMAGDITDSDKSKLTTKLIGVSNASSRLIDSSMDKTLGGFPQLETTAKIAGSLATIAAREILLGREVKSGRYIASPKGILNLQSQSTLVETMQTLNRFRQSRRDQS